MLKTVSSDIGKTLPSSIGVEKNLGGPTFLTSGYISITFCVDLLQLRYDMG